MSHFLPPSPYLSALSSSAALCLAAHLVIQRLAGALSEVGADLTAEAPHCPVVWIAVAHSLGVKPIGLRHATLTAVTLHHIRHGWLIVFNRAARQEVQCRYLIHEIAEYLLASAESDCLGSVVVRQPVENVKAWRHQVACLVTEMVLGK